MVLSRSATSLLASLLLLAKTLSHILPLETGIL
jgi:hypothetical protein